MNSPGDFSHIKDNITRDTLNLTYQAITNTNSWDFLKIYSPPMGKGFMFASHPQLSKIVWECEKLGCGHSGYSWGFVMYEMEAIAKRGWDNYLSNM